MKYKLNIYLMLIFPKLKKKLFSKFTFINSKNFFCNKQFKDINIQINFKNQQQEKNDDKYNNNITENKKYKNNKFKEEKIEDYFDSELFIPLNVDNNSNSNNNNFGFLLEEIFGNVDKKAKIDLTDKNIENLFIEDTFEVPFTDDKLMNELNIVIHY